MGRGPGQIKTFKRRIRALRVERKLTLKQVAEAIGKSEATVGKYETGETPITVDQLEAIARVLGVSAADLLTESVA